MHNKEVKETTFTNDEVGDEVKLEKIIHASILNIGYVDEGDNEDVSRIFINELKMCFEEVYVWEELLNNVKIKSES